MYPIHRILVAIKDPLARSQPAVDKAAVIAAALDAQIQLFHAIDEPVYPQITPLLEQQLQQVEAGQRERFRRQLERIATRLRKRRITVSTAVEWDFPCYEAIIRNATKFGANLIVASDKATVHRLPWLLRYTDWELVRASPIPVLLVKSPRPYRRPVILAALDPTHAYAKPAGLDSEILHFSGTLAQALQGELHAVHGYVPVPANIAPVVLSTPGALEKMLAAAETSATESLRQVAEPMGISGSCLHVEGRHPADAVQEVARETHSQIVALGSISRSGIDRLLLGNTAEKLIDSLQCDILVVKAQTFPHRVARAPRGARLAAVPVT
ncbi:MAG TPA: universal stress protein [Steroidobacteraceae bacterium]|nr:universal stress protein [Steroidobacteraceae bacterium]